MATIVTAETLQATVHGGTVRYLFQYTLDNGEIHRRRAWVPVNTNEATERTARGNALLNELANEEIGQVLG
jgi:hypothetical protein